MEKTIWEQSNDMAKPLVTLTMNLGELCDSKKILNPGI
jgi:hypothetical protein